MLRSLFQQGAAPKRAVTPHVLPPDARRYAETPLFTHETVPTNLLHHHLTKAGVWGRISVTTGSLNYVIPADARLNTERFSKILRPGIYGIIAPEQIHFVELRGPVGFKVEFLRR